VSDRRARMLEGDIPMGPASRGPARWLGPLIGLAWLAIPMADLLASGPASWELVLAFLALGAFGSLYLFQVARRGHAAPRAQLVFLAGMLGLAVGLTLALGTAWSTLFVYSAAAAGVRLPPRYNGLAVIGILALTVGCLLLVGADDSALLAISGSVFGVGALFVMFGGLVRANEELREARAELAELAVAEERVRFARDLHDLLGHDLSLIALKAELAGRLLPGRVGEAAAEVDEIKQLTRASLAQVREAVAGYRRPTLGSELAGARVAMEAAGIDLSVDDPGASLEPEVESVLAWAVREGATNVIRHSHAGHAAITVVPGLSTASVEIADDGSGASPGDAGHGLDGLRERAGSVGGTLEAAGLPEGGFRLRVSVPARAGGAQR
jgi:two-component system, NarL family, sensor histidine kinase DesK